MGCDQSYPRNCQSQEPFSGPRRDPRNKDMARKSYPYWFNTTRKGGVLPRYGINPSPLNGDQETGSVWLTSTPERGEKGPNGISCPDSGRRKKLMQDSRAARRMLHPAVFQEEPGSPRYRTAYISDMGGGRG
ncbi:hypothetical protein NDU88_000089 [Pleurodeles waltl]|uniref:Uncharacterized protein n=1 Tax=Pleurodeles waltl TaxID=8319 RepID=A0AAV7SVM4_PLEWA|nr:hypothetical protein NDU88_000089 [Pleurodeles waltl]